MSPCRTSSNFNPLPPCGGRLDQTAWVVGGSMISIHSLRVEGDQTAVCRLGTPKHFNPLPPCGGRLMDCPPWKDDFIFQSTPSVWRETQRDAVRGGSGLFQSTPSVWRETPQAARHTAQKRWISIHSLRVEGDDARRYDGRQRLLFQSTPSVWRETALPVCCNHQQSYFNPLPPCGGRLLVPFWCIL